MPDPDQMREIDPEKYLRDHGGVKKFFRSMEPEVPEGGGFRPDPYIKHLKLPDNKELKELIERVESLENLIKMTFGGHVLINGQFVKIGI